MARFTEDLIYQPTFDLDKDLSTLNLRVEYASTMLSRRFLFVGETHNAAIDLERRNKTFFRFWDKSSIMVVNERGMDLMHGLYREDQGTMHKRGLVEEQASMEKNNSSDPMRNVKIVAQIVEQLAELKESEKRSVLIFFGQDHEKAIREELARQMPHDYKILWWSFPSIMHSYWALPPVNYANHAGYTLVGFTTPPSIGDFDMRKYLLIKGRYLDSFMLEIISPGYLRPSIGKGTAYAVYAQGVVGQMMRSKAERHAAGAQLQVSNPTSVRIVPVSDNLVYQNLVASLA